MAEQAGSGIEPPVEPRVRRALGLLERFAPAIGARWATELWCTPPSVDASLRMPPFPPAQEGGCPPIDDPRVMTAEERALIARWVAAGAPAGDAHPQTLPGKKDGPLGPPTDRFPMPESYTSQNHESDDYRCFLIDPQLTTLAPVSAVSVAPGNRQIVHHAAVFAVPPTEIDAIKKLDAADPGAEAKARELTRGGVDYAFEMAGSAAALAQRAARWSAVSTALVTRIGEHAQDLHTCAWVYGSTEEQRASALAELSNLP